MKIICIGRNYVDHVKELNSNLPTEPVFFLKPDTCVINRNQPFFYPEFSKEIHYETELVVRINKVGKHIQQKFANTYYDELTVGIDFTARDIQRQCQQKGLPWEISKGFDGAAPIGKFVKKDCFDSIQNINLKLNINNQTIQQGNTKDMIFSEGGLEPLKDSVFANELQSRTQNLSMVLEGAIKHKLSTASPKISIGGL